MITTLLGALAMSFLLDIKDWFIILAGTILSYAIVILIYYLQKKESTQHKQDHDSKLERIEQLHQQDSEKIKVLYELIIQSQRGSLGEVEAEALEKKIDAAADNIGTGDSHQAQALKAIADKQKVEADGLLAKIAQQEHDLEQLYDLHAINEYRHGNYAESAIWLKKLIDLKPENWDYHMRYNSSLSSGGMFKEAEEQSLMVLDKLKSQPVPDEKLIATWLYNTGKVKFQQDKTEEAEDYLFQALEMGKKAHGEDHPELANTYNDIGCLKMRKWEWDEAAEYIQTALRIKTNEDDQDIINTAYMKWNLASICQAQNKLEETEKLLLEGKQLIEDNFGEDHPALTYCYTKLAQFYRALKKFDDAIVYAEKSVGIFEKKHLTNHPNYLWTHNVLGLSYCLSERYEQAKTVLEKGYELALQMLGENNMTTTNAMYWLGITLSGLGQQEEAENLLLKSMQIEGNLPHISKHSQAKTYLQLSIIQNKMKKYEQAEQNLQTSLSLMQGELHDEHEDLLTGNNLLAEVYLATERPGEAEKLLLQIIPILQSADPPSPLYQQALQLLAEAYRKQGKTAEAEKLTAEHAQAERLQSE